MFVRIEEQKDHTVLIIDEIDRYLGRMYFDEFVNLINDSKEPMEEKGYLYYVVDKNELNKRIINGK